jgi:hypothetical protein
MVCAFRLVEANAGSSSAARMAMLAMTTSSSMSVSAVQDRQRDEVKFPRRWTI